MNVGLCGLPQAGKTTLFNVLTGSTYELHPGKVEVHVEVSEVEDERLAWLWSLEKSGKLTPSQITYIDVAGLARGKAARFINELRRADALLVVLRAFDDPNVPHPEGSVNPVRDYDTILLELGVADLGAVETRMGSVGRGADRGDKRAMEMVATERAVLERLSRTLDESRPVSTLALEPFEDELIRGLGLLTRKPLIPLLNVDADGLEVSNGARKLARRLPGEPLVVHAKLEGELADLEPDEALLMRREFSIPERSLQRVVQASYSALELHSFFTTNRKETKAWTLRRGGTALEAAARVHSDIARGFIRAEVAHFDDLQLHGSFAECKKRGIYRTEGRDYVVQDGDVILFRFSV